MVETLSLVDTYHVNNGDILHTTAQFKEQMTKNKIQSKLAFYLDSSY